MYQQLADARGEMMGTYEPLEEEEIKILFVIVSVANN